MIFIWGKRSYGAVERVGNISVKTVFGHLWYLPLFPITSYYIDSKSEAAFQLNGLRGRSVLFGYLRVWLPLVALGALIAARAPGPDGSIALAALVGTLAVAGFIGTYLYDRKSAQEKVVQLRLMMQRHFGLALDPYECQTSLQQEINNKRQAGSTTPLDESWYRQAIKDAFTDKENLELALLRARCEQHDKELQQLVMAKVK
jgi:hypothetical protein